jgi:hypothetical protein
VKTTDSQWKRRGTLPTEEDVLPLSTTTRLPPTDASLKGQSYPTVNTVQTAAAYWHLHVTAIAHNNVKSRQEPAASDSSSDLNGQRGQDEHSAKDSSTNRAEITPSEVFDCC